MMCKDSRSLVDKTKPGTMVLLPSGKESQA